MKRKESKKKVSQTEEPSVSLKSKDNEPIARVFVKIQKREKRMAAKSDYESLFHLLQHPEKSQDHTALPKSCGKHWQR